MKQELETSDSVLNRLILGYGLSQAIYLAAKLGISDLLVGGPRDGDDLASATNTITQCYLASCASLPRTGCSKK